MFTTPMSQKQISIQTYSKLGTDVEISIDFESLAMERFYGVGRTSQIASFAGTWGNP